MKIQPQFSITQLQNNVNRAIASRQFKEAERFLVQLREAYGPHPDFLYLDAYICMQLNKYDRAVELAKLALKEKCQRAAELYMILGFAQRKRFFHREAIHALEKSNRIALQKKNMTDSAFIGRNLLALGQLYLYVGDLEQSKRAYLKASRCDLDLKERREAYSSYLLCLHYSNDCTNEQIFAHHKAYNTFFPKLVDRPLLSERKKRKIRVGYISPDFRRHVMCFFYQAFLRYYDKTQFEVYCYCLNESDEITVQMRNLPDQWRDLIGESAEQAARMICCDELDILFDLAGHSANNALPILKYHPAMVQISGLGYFNTTGMQEVDYFLADSFVAPPGKYDHLFTEELIRLPNCQFCYKPWDDTPPARSAPCLRNGYITFGCFNKYAKITDWMIKIWNDILRQVPRSKLVLKSLVYVDEDLCREIKRRFERFGITEEKLELRPATSNYMEEWTDIDIALDTFPYPGGGTTCDALYMGVPVITLKGDRMGARFGYSILNNAGLGELVAENKTEYIERAVGLSTDWELIDVLHSNLRSMMLASPLMNANLYMRQVESIYKKILEEKWS